MATANKLTVNHFANPGNTKAFREAKPVRGSHTALVKAASKRSHEQYGEAYRELVNR